MTDDGAIPRSVVPAAAVPAIVHFDGACQTVGGRRVAAYGCTVEGPGLAHEESGLAVPPDHPRATNNVAEYVGAIRALEWLTAVPYRGEVVVFGDSELVVRQMRGEYEVRADHLRPYHERLRQLVDRFSHVEFRWLRREENRRADALSKDGIYATRRRPSGPARGSDENDTAPPSHDGR
ncbi:MAG TPA: ribonuclease HI family protein [Thermoplasmata archaeon]|nr:ribonuclease HI family protein [Thermoplasmata archaeon]